MTNVYEVEEVEVDQNFDPEDIMKEIDILESWEMDHGLDYEEVSLGDLY